MGNKIEDRGPMLKYNKKMWAVTNFGILRSVHFLKRDAIEEVSKESYDWQKYYEIRKVTVSEGWN